MQWSLQGNVLSNKKRWDHKRHIAISNKDDYILLWWDNPFSSAFSFLLQAGSSLAMLFIFKFKYYTSCT